MKKVLVLMSAYNGERYIADQINSIMTQSTECHISLRIRDDGSTDKTCEIIRKLQVDYGTGIELICGENIGYNGSFFELLSTADGYDYYAFSDQDDIWLPQKIQTAVEWIDSEFRNAKLPILYASTSCLVEDDLKPYGITRQQVRPFTLYNTIVQNICPGHNQVMNQEMLEVVKSKIKNAEVYVYDSWITNLAILYGKVLFNNEPQTYYRQHRTNALGSGSGTITQILTSMKHARAGHGMKYRNQIEQFINLNADALTLGNYIDELQQFISAKRFFKRTGYAFRSKLYRQKKLETIALRFAIIIGSF